MYQKQQSMNYSPKGLVSEPERGNKRFAKGWLGRQTPVSAVVFFRSLWSRQRGDDGLRASGSLSRLYISLGSRLLTDVCGGEKSDRLLIVYCCSNKEQGELASVVQDPVSFWACVVAGSEDLAKLRHLLWQALVLWWKQGVQEMLFVEQRLSVLGNPCISSCILHCHCGYGDCPLYSIYEGDCAEESHESYKCCWGSAQMHKIMEGLYNSCRCMNWLSMYVVQHIGDQKSIEWGVKGVEAYLSCIW